MYLWGRGMGLCFGSLEVQEDPKHDMDLLCDLGGSSRETPVSWCQVFLEVQACGSKLVSCNENLCRKRSCLSFQFPQVDANALDDAAVKVGHLLKTC